MSGDINVQSFSGKVNISNNLLVGSSHLFVDTVNNRVGITTADPDAGLHVNSNAYVNTDFRVGSSIVMNDTDGQITAGSFVGDGSAITGINSDSGSWVNGTNSNVHLATLTDKVGIGKTNPDTALDVSGTVKSTHVSLGTPLNPTIGGNWVTIVNSTYDGDIGDEYPEPEGGILFTNQSSANRFPWGYYMGVVKDVASPNSTSIRFDIGKSSNLNTNEGTGGTDTLTPYLTIDNGNVGIGTETPLQTLEVNGSVGINHNVVGGYTFHTNTGALRAGIHSLGGNHLLFKTGANNERMRLLASGELGIGTTNPSCTLDVRGSGITSGIFSQRLWLTAIGDNSGNGSPDDNSGSPWYGLGYDNLAWNNQSYKYSGDIPILSGYSGVALRSGSGNLVLTTAGNVGVGTTNPGAKLDVQGDINSTGKINIGTYAVGQGYMASKTLTLGDIASNYGGGNNWNTNTAALMFECADNTEIAVHDSGTRVASLIHFEGASTHRITIGRDMGWGTIASVRMYGSQSYPNRPVAMVGKTNNRVYSPNVIVYNSVLYNDGGLYNTSNGRFTAPAGYAGYYLVTFTGLAGEREVAPNTRWQLNGNDLSWGAAHVNMGSGVNMNTTNARLGMNNQFIYYLNAGDYLTHRVITGSIYGSSSTHTTTVVMFMGSR